jgi:hypothetical protein
MPKIINYFHRKRRPMVAPRRSLIWIEGSHFQGSGCSECAWVFSPSGSPAGDSLAEMMEEYERRRDKEFAAHVCAEHPRPKNANAK